MEDTNQFFGHSAEELQRSVKQAQIIRATTQRLLLSAGIKQGMRILDVGCGTGDAAVLAADLVGTTGLVMGIDRSAELLAVARSRVQALGLLHARFSQASIVDFEAGQFDLVIARYVLVHQVDPIAFLRAAARFVRRGGILALHEPIVDRPPCSRPRVDLWQRTADQVLETFRSTLLSGDAGSRLFELFARAELPEPQVFSETPVGGGFDAPHYAWLAELTRSLLPRGVQIGQGTQGIGDIDTLESRLKAAVTAARSQVEGFGQMCAWANL